MKIEHQEQLRRMLRTKPLPPTLAKFIGDMLDQYKDRKYLLKVIDRIVDEELRK